MASPLRASSLGPRKSGGDSPEGRASVTQRQFKGSGGGGGDDDLIKEAADSAVDSIVGIFDKELAIDEPAPAKSAAAAEGSGEAAAAAAAGGDAAIANPRIVVGGDGDAASTDARAALVRSSSF